MQIPGGGGGGLPAGYTQVSGIKSVANISGGTRAYINTCIVPNVNMRVVVSGITAQSVGSAGFIFGSRTSTQVDRFWMVTWNDMFKYGFGDDHNDDITSALSQQPFDADFNFNSNHEMKVNGVAKRPHNYSGNTYTKPIYLFGLNNGGTLDATQFEAMTISTFKVFRNYADSLPIMDMIPCVRDSDSTVGMYDIVSNTFFTSAGGADFIVPT